MYRPASALGAKILGVTAETVPVWAAAGLGALPSMPAPTLGANPPTALRPFRGPEDTLRAMAEAALGARGEKSMLVRGFAEFLLRDVQPKDYLGEIIAIRNALVMQSPWRPGAPLFRYANDPRHVEMVKDPQRQVEEIQAHGSTVVDCDDEACMAACLCMIIGREVELVAVGFAPGELSHVAVRAKEPKTGQWIWMDGVAGPREREAARKATEILVWSLD